MEQIKPSEISLTSKVSGEEITKHFKIGRYPATEGLFLFGLAVEVLGSSVKNNSSDLPTAKKIKEFAVEVCKYVEAKMPNGDYIKLDQKLLIDSHVPDYEMLMMLVREVHDYNSNFFSTGRILKKSLSVMDQAKLLITKTLTQYSPSSSPKKSQRSKN